MAEAGTRLTQVFKRDALIARLHARDKEGVLQEMMTRLSERGAFDTKQMNSVIKALQKREERGSTAIGKGLAVPHGEHAAVERLVGAVGLSPDGIEFNSLDGQPVHAVFLVLSPSDAHDEHIQILRRITELMRDEDLCRFLKQCKDEKAMAELLQEADEKLSRGPRGS